MKTTDRVVIYGRPDDIDNLLIYSSVRGFQVVEVFERTKSNVKVQILEVMDFLKESNVHTLLVGDCSTLSRHADEFLAIMNDFCKEKVNVHFRDNKIDSMLYGKVNPVFRFGCKLLDEFDTIRRTQTRNRLRNGFRTYINNGGKVGRKIGYRKGGIDYELDYPKEISMLKDGFSIKEVQRITGTCENTLRKLKKHFV